ncbi:MAG: LLM class flavin-dependent oxidoreductase [Acidimicrobiales bacterium]
MKLSLVFPETRSLDAVRDLAVTTEAQGFHGMWLGSAFGFDPIMALALAGSATSRLSLGVAVIPSWPRHPVVAAQQAATANAACAGRFRLGVGPSHGPVMQMYGIEMDRPVSHSREYLDVVRTLLHTGAVDHEGERFRVQGFLDIEGAGIGSPTTAPPVLLAVLRTQMARVAGGHADGALCWLTPAPYLAEVVAPAIRQGADDTGRDAPPPLVAELPCALATDREAVHAMAAADLGIYPQMPYYRNMFEAAGVELDGRRWSDDMIDAAVVWGDADRIGEKVAALFAAGADEVVLSPFGVGAAADASQAECIAVLSELART